MAAGPVGPCWATGSWSDTAWEEGTWGISLSTTIAAAYTAVFVRLPAVARMVRLTAIDRLTRALR